MKKSLNLTISLRDTNVFKGIAICGMLMWHIFYCNNPYGIEYSSFVRFVGAIGDFCVSAFLLVSGYGLTVQYESCQDEKGVRYVIRRLLKFYSNYWFIFVLVVLYGTFVMKMPVRTDGTVMNQIKQWLLEFFAIRGQASYNDSWWFFSLIISFYLIFPMLYWGFKKALIPTALFVMLEQSLSLKFIGQSLQIYMPIFCIGILWAMYRDKISSSISKVPYLYLGLIFSFLFFPTLKLRCLFQDGGLWYRAIGVYGCLSVGLMLFILAFLRNDRNIFAIGVSFLGKHSFNIYIIHLMFSKYWYSKFFYSFSSPWLIFISLLLTSLLFSMAVDWLKDKSGYNALTRKCIAYVDDLLMKTCVR